MHEKKRKMRGQTEIKILNQLIPIRNIFSKIFPYVNVQNFFYNFFATSKLTLYEPTIDDIS